MKVQGVETSGYLPQQQEAGARRAGPPETKKWPEGKDQEDREMLEEAVEKANKTMETYGTELRFSIHQASGEIMVKVIDTRDNSVIREIPPERILNFVAHVKKMLGLIIDKFI